MTGREYKLAHAHKLKGVDPLLSMTTLMAIAHVNREDFFIRVTSGVRTLDEQKKLVEKGASQTLASKHLAGMAVDIAIIHDGVYEQRAEYYEAQAVYFRQFFELVRKSALFDYAPANRLVWGGDWKMRDLGHFELA